jgi:hypothetical protein
MRRPTERRAYLAARQLAHHRERLPWMRERMEENERLLRERLEESGERRLVLSGGFAVARRGRRGDRRPAAHSGDQLRAARVGRDPNDARYPEGRRSR